MQDNGFLRLDNSITDYWMSRLNHSEFKTLLAVYRKTVGWNKQYDKISQSQISELTGLTTRSVGTAILSLEQQGLIIVTGKDKTAKVFSINKYKLYSVCLKSVEIIEMEETLENISKTSEENVKGKENSSLDSVNNFVHKRHSKETNKIKVKETVCTKESINIPFSDFWTKYDYCKGKKSDVEAKWIALSNEERTLTMESLGKYLLSTPDKTYRKYPMSYLNTEAWNDEIVLIDNQNIAQSSLSNRNSASSNSYSASFKLFEDNIGNHIKDDLECNLEALGYCSDTTTDIKNTTDRTIDNKDIAQLSDVVPKHLHWSELKAKGLLKTKVNPNAVAPNTDTDEMINDFLARNSSSRFKDKIYS